MKLPLCACGCGSPIPPKDGPGARPKYLTEHSPHRRPSRPRRNNPPSVPRLAVIPAGDGGEDDEGALVAATREELERAGRAGTPEGLIVITLAAQIAKGGGTQAGMASLVREFHASKERALSGAAEANDPVVGFFAVEAG